MKPMNDATTALLRALTPSFAGFQLMVEEVRSRSWASATFMGARHELSLRITGDDAGKAVDDFLTNLDTAEFKLRGHVLADIALVSDERPDHRQWVRLSLEALTVEDV